MGGLFDENASQSFDGKHAVWDIKAGDTRDFGPKRNHHRPGASPFEGGSQRGEEPISCTWPFLGADGREQTYRAQPLGITVEGSL